MNKLERKIYEAQELLEEAKDLVAEHERLSDDAQMSMDRANDDTIKLRDRFKYLGKAFKSGIKAGSKNRQVTRKLRRVRKILGVFS